MNFDELEVVTDKPVFVQFNNPFTGKPLFEQMADPEDETKKIDNPDKAVGVNLFGQDSEPFIKRRRFLADQMTEEALSQRNKKKRDNDKDSNETIKACIHSFVNVEWKGAPLDARRAEFDDFFAKHRWARDFCNLAIMDRTNFQKTS